ncbi:Multi antimicrobial extrusion protein (Na(+)/drug antiporter), MATE family of MDR efflux pumps [hydrothermal vent metagenome]|uniref:Multidrug-efflux transporter n=1 Tax=hydrothermal vent metagenome TaxID=652676 RepID=A0A3B0TY70_9ZZZZ
MKDFTSGNVPRQILQFSGPLVLGSVFQNLYNVVDSIVVGNVLGKEALAAVGASFPVLWTLISLVVGIGSGASTVVSQYFGAKDNKSVLKTIDTIYIFFFGASILVTIVGITLSEPIFRLLRLPEELIPDATLYMQIYLSGMFLLFGFNGTTSILRGLGDSQTPLVFIIIAAVLNTILDLLFVMVFKWGIASVAIATVLANGFAFAGGIWYLNRTHPIIKFSLKHIHFDKKIFKSCVRIGLPTGFQQSFVAIGMMAVMGIVNGFGTNAIAAYTAALRVDSFAKMPSIAFASALASFTGQNQGAFKDDRIKRGLYSTVVISGLYSIFISGLIILFGRGVMTLFTDDPDVIKIGQDYLVIVSSFYILFSLMFSVMGLLRGAGATLIPMVITIISLWIVRIPLSIFLSKKIGVNGIWWALPVSWVIGLLIIFIYYQTGKWHNKGVVKEGLNQL